MSIFRQLTLLVSLAVLGAAILLGSSDAKAHAGHKHHPLSLPSSTTSKGSAAIADGTSIGQSTREVISVKSAPALVIDVFMQANGNANIENARAKERSPLSHECVPGCCDDCMACCGIAYTVGSSALLSTARFERISLPGPVGLRQHDPEADRKPPRSLI